MLVLNTCKCSTAPYYVLVGDFLRVKAATMFDELILSIPFKVL